MQLLFGLIEQITWYFDSLDRKGVPGAFISTLTDQYEKTLIFQERQYATAIDQDIQEQRDMLLIYSAMMHQISLKILETVPVNEWRSSMIEAMMASPLFSEDQRRQLGEACEKTMVQAFLDDDDVFYDMIGSMRQKSDGFIAKTFKQVVLDHERSLFLRRPFQTLFCLGLFASAAVKENEKEADALLGRMEALLGDYQTDYFRNKHKIKTLCDLADPVLDFAVRVQGSPFAQKGLDLLSVHCQNMVAASLARSQSSVTYIGEHQAVSDEDLGDHDPRYDIFKMIVALAEQTEDEADRSKSRRHSPFYGLCQTVFSDTVSGLADMYPEQTVMCAMRLIPALGYDNSIKHGSTDPFVDDIIALVHAQYKAGLQEVTFYGDNTQSLAKWLQTYAGQTVRSDTARQIAQHVAAKPEMSAGDRIIQLNKATTNLHASDDPACLEVVHQINEILEREINKPSARGLLIPRVFDSQLLPMAKRFGEFTNDRDSTVRLLTNIVDLIVTEIETEPFKTERRLEAMADACGEHESLAPLKTRIMDELMPRIFAPVDPPALLTERLNALMHRSPKLKK